MLWYLLISLGSLFLINQWLSIISNKDGFSYVNGSRKTAETQVYSEIKLTCDDLDEITRIAVIGEGAVKVVRLAKWKHQLIALSELKDTNYQDDFNHNRAMLIKLADSNKVVKLLGACNDTFIITQFHPLGSPLNLPFWTQSWPNKILNGTLDCLKLCLHYVDLINFFHTHPSGPLVMCDSNSLEKLLSQFLLSLDDVKADTQSTDSLTSGLRLIANDLDALPSVKRNGIKCGSRQIFGTFAAPEQHWPYLDRPFNDSKMPVYNEKIDIWKIPDVCAWFLKFSSDSEFLLARLKPIHIQCKQIDPSARPSAAKVHQSYMELYSELLVEMESNYSRK